MELAKTTTEATMSGIQESLDQLNVMLSRIAARQEKMLVHWKKTAVALTPTATTSRMLPSQGLEEPGVSPSLPSLFSAVQVVGASALHADTVIASAMPSRCLTEGPGHYIDRGHAKLVFPASYTTHLPATASSSVGDCMLQGVGRAGMTTPAGCSTQVLLIADSSDQVLTQVNGVSLFLEHSTQHAEVVFSELHSMKPEVLLEDVYGSDEVLSHVGGLSIFLEFDLDLSVASVDEVFHDHLSWKSHAIYPWSNAREGSHLLLENMLPHAFCSGHSGMPSSYLVLDKWLPWSRNGFSPGFHDRILNTRLINFWHEKAQVDQLVRYVVEVQDAERKCSFGTLVSCDFRKVLLICLMQQKHCGIDINSGLTKLLRYTVFTQDCGNICSISVCCSTPRILSEIIREATTEGFSGQSLLEYTYPPPTQLALTCQDASLLHEDQLLANRLHISWDPGGSMVARLTLYSAPFVGHATVYSKNNLLIQSMRWKDNRAVVPLAVEIFVQWDQCIMMNYLRDEIASVEGATAANTFESQLQYKKWDPGILVAFPLEDGYCVLNRNKWEFTLEDPYFFQSSKQFIDNLRQARRRSRQWVTATAIAWGQAMFLGGGIVTPGYLGGCGPGSHGPRAGDCGLALPVEGNKREKPHLEEGMEEKN